MIVLVSATRHSSEQFYRRSLLGMCVQEYMRLGYPIKPCIAFDNRRGLPAVYNAAIDEVQADDIIVFVHDDVMILDHFWPERVLSGFRQFDLLGLAGNVQRAPRQQSWCIIDGGQLDHPQNLSGSVAHGTAFPFVIYAFGPPLRQCRLLDGVFLAIKKATLSQSGLSFDERFDFHCYDMDFCRQAEQRGLTMGTIPLAIMHASVGGAFGSASWRENWKRYLDKWRETDAVSGKTVPATSDLDTSKLYSTAISPIMAQHAPNRNALCPCGSGKRFKHCHGRFAPPASS